MYARVENDQKNEMKPNKKMKEITGFFTKGNSILLSSLIPVLISVSFQRARWRAEMIVEWQKKRLLVF